MFFVRKSIIFAANYNNTIFVVMKKCLVLVLSVLTMISCSNKSEQNASDAVINNILTRVSVRHFTDEKPSDEQIETMLRCAMAAPSAVNRQPWAFIVVDDKDLLKQIGERLPNTRVQNNAQMCFVVCGDLRAVMEGEAQEFWIHDCSAATENLLLAAHSMGLGAVWCAMQPGKDRIATLREILSIPNYFIPLCVVPVGYPAEEPQVKDKWRTEKIFHNAWE